MAFQQTPQGLAQLYSLPPEAVMDGMRLQEQMQQSDAMSLQNQGRQLQYDQQADPFKLAQLGLQNQTTQAQLPGAQADSSMRVRKNSNEEWLNPQMVKDLQGKYKSAELKRHVDDIDALGEVFTRSASGIASNPLVGKAKLKQQLEDSGHGDMWNPAWDNLSPDELFNAINTRGKQIQDTSSKFRHGLGLLDAKGDNAAEVARIGADSRETIANNRAAAVRAVQAAKGSSDPKTLEAGFSAALKHSMEATDPQEKAAFQAAAQAFQQQLHSLAAVKGIAGRAGNVDAAGVTGMAPLTIPAAPPIGAAAVPATTQAPAQGSYKYNSPDGQNWVKRAMQANPGMSEEQIIMQGKQLKKLVD